MRKPLSKKIRFEIFKRDGFVCQYCGAHPPSIVLQVDHIIPVAKGGLNGIDNLITSCQPCNIGKGARELNIVPQPLALKAKEIEEKEAQLIGYSKIMEERRLRIENQCWEIIHILYGKDVNSIDRNIFASIKMFIDKIGIYHVAEAADITLNYGIMDDVKSFKYFCGVCWRIIKGDDRATR